MSTVEEFNNAALQSLDISAELDRVGNNLNAAAAVIRRLQRMEIRSPFDETGEALITPPGVDRTTMLAREADILDAIAIQVYGHSGAWGREGQAIANATPKDIR